MTEEYTSEHEVLAYALSLLSDPKSNNSVRTVAHLPDMRSVLFFAALDTLGKELGDPALANFVEEALVLTRSLKRKGAKEVVDMMRAARTRTVYTTVLSGMKRILVGRHEEPELE